MKALISICGCYIQLTIDNYPVAERYVNPDYVCRDLEAVALADAVSKLARSVRHDVALDFSPDFITRFTDALAEWAPDELKIRGFMRG